jgi:suppressor for copper-sensitivity B
MKRWVFLLLLTLIYGIANPPLAAASASAWAATEHGKVRLIAAVEGTGAGRFVSVGLHFRPEPGWKIYWRTPGDAGFPPRVDWSGSTNLARATFAWPAPARFAVLGFETVGYEGELVLPIEAMMLQPGEALGLQAVVDYLTCKEICVPYTAELAMTIPSGPAVPSDAAPLIAWHLATVPDDGVRHGLSLDRLTVEGAGEATRLRLIARAVDPFQSPDAFIEGPSGLAYGPPSVELADDGREAALTIPVHGAGERTEPLDETLFTVTLVDGDRSAERSFGGPAAPPAPATAEPSRSLPLFLAFGFLGGLILNLMPCVLPVLSIKLLSVIGHGGGDPRAVRLGFLASTAGILFAFLVLATALTLLKASGTAVGWGFQFQQSWFLIGMTLVVTLFACNLWGLFEIRLPAALGHLGTSLGQGHGLVAHFMTGALATVLATPCSAPFLGTAVGFALSRGAGETFAVFLALGLGLATPYLLVAAFPKLATRLPRPGPWMATVRRLLGFTLAATALWLIWVIAGQAEQAAALILGAVALAIVVVLAAGRRLPERLRLVRPVAVGLLAGGAFVFVPMRPDPIFARDANDAWILFDEKQIPALVASGRIVYVNVTADWCITCRVNERLVLDQAAVRERILGSEVIAMRADWTRPNEDIARFLARFGRYGIPFDAVFGPSIPGGEALPEILTETAVLSALDRASGDGGRAAAPSAPDRRASASR